MPSSGFQTCALRSEEHTSELQSHDNLVCLLLLEKKKQRRQVADFDQEAPRPRATDCKLETRHDPHFPNLSWSDNTGKLIGNMAAFFFFFNDTATTEIYTLSLHDALPI